MFFHLLSSCPEKGVDDVPSPAVHDRGLETGEIDLRGLLVGMSHALADHREWHPGTLSSRRPGVPGTVERETERKPHLAPDLPEKVVDAVAFVAEVAL